MRNRRIALIVGVALVMLVAVRHPTADIRILTHDTADLSPHRIQAMIDTGVVAVDVLVTWSAERLAR